MPISRAVLQGKFNVQYSVPTSFLVKGDHGHDTGRNRQRRIRPRDFLRPIGQFVLDEIQICRVLFSAADNILLKQTGMR
jgi:hypothetical protein